MRTLRTTDCPAWCCLAHRGDSLISHEGHAIIVPIGRSDNGGEFLEVRTVQYFGDDSGTANSASDHVPFVEVAHHIGGQYRLINMSSTQTRAFVDALLRCAEVGKSDTGADPCQRE